MGKRVDDAVVERARGGDAEAFTELYAAMAQPLFKTACYIIGNPSDAEDVVMDTIADAFAGISKLRECAAFEGWIYKILYNKAKRKKGITLWRGETELTDDLPESNGVDFIENADLKTALALLSLEERTILILSVCFGYSSLEISDVMSLNANTVRSKQSRALAKMEKYMQINEGRGNNEH